MCNARQRPWTPSFFFPTSLSESMIRIFHQCGSTSLILAVVIAIAVAQTCSYGLRAIGECHDPRIAVVRSASTPTSCTCCDMCTTRAGPLAACELQCFEGCLALAMARGGIALRLSFEHSGGSCGSAERPCRMATIGADVFAAATSMMVGQAECSLVLDVRTSPAASPTADARAAGLRRFTATGVFCTAGNFTLFAVASVASGITVLRCTGAGPCAAMLQDASALAGVADGKLPWQATASSVVVGGGEPVGGSQAWTPGVLTAFELMLPNETGNIELPIAFAGDGGNSSDALTGCVDTAGPTTTGETATVDAMVVALLEVAQAGIGERSPMKACLGAMSTAYGEDEQRWAPPLQTALSSAEAWQAVALPTCTADALRYLAQERGYAAFVAIFVVAAVAFALATAALACCDREKRRRRRRSRDEPRDAPASEESEAGGQRHSATKTERRKKSTVDGL